MNTDKDTNVTVAEVADANDQTTEQSTPAAAATDDNNTPAKDAGNSKTLRYFAAAGAVCTLLAWAFLVISEWASMSLDVAAIVLSALACRLRPGNMRNLAITALIAAATLALVFVTLFVLLHIIENI